MPNISKRSRAATLGHVPVTARPARRSNAMAKAILAGMVRVIWVVTVLVWPVLRWVLSFEVLFQMMRMVYHWNTPGMHAGWTFVLHFAALTALTYFVSAYTPKGL